MKKNIVIALLVVFATSCRVVKKMQPLQTAIDKKDTVKVTVLPPSSTAGTVDSSVVVATMLAKIQQGKIEFSTFNAKLKVVYEGATESQQLTAYVSIKKDSAIFAKIALSPFGVVAQVLITKDSVLLIRTKGAKSVQYRSIAYLKEITEIPFDFYTLQDILLGNPIFLSSNIVSYKYDNPLQILMIGDVFKHLITIDTVHHFVLHSKLDDINATRNRTCDISFSNYENTIGVNFATYRKISVSEKSKLDINLEFKQYDFEPLKYTFTVPKKYKVK